MAITDFTQWLDAADVSDLTTQEMYHLYHSIAEKTEYAPWHVSIAGEKLFIKADYFEESLMIASEKARDAFLELLRNKFFGGWDVESWYGYNSALENPNA